MEILSIGIALIISIAILWAQHYSPWTRWLGRELPRTWAYTLGTLAMIVPLTGLYAFWHFNIERLAWPPMVMVVTALWTVVVGSGITVYELHLIDRMLLERLRANIAELEAAKLRNGFVDGQNDE